MNIGPPHSAEHFDTTVRICIVACEAVLEHGTPEMKALARALLAATGRALAERIADDE